MKLARRAAAAIVSAGVLSFAYQQIADARDRQRFSSPGRRVDIGGRRVHIVTAGTGSPAVIIIPAIGGITGGWAHIQQAVAGETTICVYDRPGTGWSDPPAPGKLTPDAMAADLFALLNAAEVKPPYILAGHSFGGIIARRFRACHPEVVAGMLLIDSSHEEQAPRLPGPDWREAAESLLAKARWSQATVLGMRRLAAEAGLLDLDDEIALVSSPQYVAEARAIILSSRHQQATAREMSLLARTWGQPASLGSLPLTVLTSANRPWDGYPAWAQMQAELAALSSDSQHVTSQRAGHQIHLDEPELVKQAISDLVKRCRLDA